MVGLQYQISLNHIEYPMNIGRTTNPRDLLSATLQLFMQSYSNSNDQDEFNFYNSADKETYYIHAKHHALDDGMLNKLIFAKKLDNKIKNNSSITPTFKEAKFMSACIQDYIRTFAGIVDLTKLEYLSKILQNMAVQYKELRA